MTRERRDKPIESGIPNRRSPSLRRPLDAGDVPDEFRENIPPNESETAEKAPVVETPEAILDHQPEDRGPEGHSPRGGS